MVFDSIENPAAKPSIEEEPHTNKPAQILNLDMDGPCRIVSLDDGDPQTVVDNSRKITQASFNQWDNPWLIYSTLVDAECIIDGEVRPDFTERRAELKEVFIDKLSRRQLPLPLASPEIDQIFDLLESF